MRLAATYSRHSIEAAHMHVDDLTISPTSTDRSCNNDQRISVYEIPYASLILGTVARVCNKVEFEGV